MRKTDVVPFGKYKGQPVEVLAEHREYCEWLMKQDWFRTEKFQSLYTLIVNNFGEPAETPEHNQLQARFTDVDFQQKFVWHVESGQIISVFRERKVECLKSGSKRCDEYQEALRECQDKIEESHKQLEIKKQREAEGESSFGYLGYLPIEETVERLEKHIVRLQEKRTVAESCMKMIEFVPDPVIGSVKTSVAFEVAGTDVVLIYRVSGFLDTQDFELDDYRLSYRWYLDSFNEKGEALSLNIECKVNDLRYSRNGDQLQLHIECKPSLGDEYPAVLRQILACQSRFSRSTSSVLLVGYAGYVGTGATLEQVKAIFESRQIRIVFLRDVESVKDSQECPF